MRFQKVTHGKDMEGKHSITTIFLSSFKGLAEMRFLPLYDFGL